MAVRVEMNKTHTPPNQEVAIVVGRLGRLAVLEVTSTLRRAGVTIDGLTVAGDVVLVKATPTPDAAWFRRLGGAVKFGRVLARTTLLETWLESPAIPSTIRTVGVSTRGALDPHAIGRQIKAASASIRRFVTPREGKLLSAAQSRHVRYEGGIELLFLEDQNELVVVEIQAEQDVNDFTKRDREAPEAHGKRGMLPTKLARTMVNIGLGHSTRPQPVLLDPFCGTGRVLMEGVLLGAEVLGADLDPVAVAASRSNLRWLASEYGVGDAAERVLQSSIDKLPPLLSPASVDVIVTEPFLGPPQHRALTDREVDELFKQVRPAYEQLLRAGQTLLVGRGAMVVVFPAIGDRSLDGELVDRIGGFGYHVLDSIRVERPDQFIARTIVILERRDGS